MQQGQAGQDGARATKKRQHWHFSGKKNRHTPKAQLMANLSKEEFLATTFCFGKKHDFKLFKDNRTAIAAHIKVLADTGYQGLTEHHTNSKTPAKNPSCIR